MPRHLLAVMRTGQQPIDQRDPRRLGIFFHAATNSNVSFGVGGSPVNCMSPVESASLPRRRRAAHPWATAPLQRHPLDALRGTTGLDIG